MWSSADRGIRVSMDGSESCSAPVLSIFSFSLHLSAFMPLVVFYKTIIWIPICLTVIFVQHLFLTIFFGIIIILKKKNPGKH